MSDFQFAPMYDPTLVQPMRDEVTKLGVSEIKDPDQVEERLKEEGTTLLFINSVCGCAAGAARPALSLAMQHDTKPDRAISVFAGQDRAATEKAREQLHGYPPSSPMFALFKDGQVVHVVPRHHIEGRSAEMIAQDLVGAFESYCGSKA